jgi:hypothetical protein
MGGGRAKFGENHRASPFNKGLSNEAHLSQIHLAVDITFKRREKTTLTNERRIKWLFHVQATRQELVNMGGLLLPLPMIWST